MVIPFFVVESDAILLVNKIEDTWSVDDEDCSQWDSQQWNNIEHSTQPLDKGFNTGLFFNHSTLFTSDTDVNHDDSKDWDEPFYNPLDWLWNFLTTLVLK